MSDETEKDAVPAPEGDRLEENRDAEQTGGLAETPTDPEQASGSEQVEGGSEPTDPGAGEAPGGEQSSGGEDAGASAGGAAAE